MRLSINSGYSLAADCLAACAFSAIAAGAAIATFSTDSNINSAAHAYVAAYGGANVGASECRATSTTAAAITAITADSFSG